MYYLVRGLSQTLGSVVDLNVTRLGFAFTLISFVHTQGAVVVPQFVGEGGGGLFKIGRPRSREWKKFGRKIDRGWRVLKIRQFSWTSYVYRP